MRITESCIGPRVGSARRVAVCLVAALALPACRRGDAPRADTAVVIAPPVDTPVDTLAVPPVDSALAPVDPVDAFLRFADAQSTGDTTAVVEDVAARGVRLLAEALDAVVARDTVPAAAAGSTTTASSDTTAAGGAVALRARIARLRTRADSLQEAPGSPERARQVGEAFVAASDVLQALQARGRPALTDRAAEARLAATAVRVDVALAEQPDAVRRFLVRAAAALRGIVGARPTTGPA